jgi:hypothetical protein
MLASQGLIKTLLYSRYYEKKHEKYIFLNVHPDSTLDRTLKICTNIFPKEKDGKIIDPMPIFFSTEN